MASGRGSRRVSNEEEKRRLRIHRTAKSDLEAARRAGIGPSAWRRWARRRGLKAKGEAPPRPSDAEFRRRLEILESSRTVEEAAQRMGVSHGAVYNLMRRAKRNPFAETIRRRHSEWVSLMRQGLSNREIARRYGADEAAVRYVRKKAGLPSSGKVGGRPKRRVNSSPNTHRA